MRADVVHRNNRGAGWGAASPACVSSDGAPGWVMSLSGRCRSQNVPEKIGWNRAGIESLIGAYACARELET